MKKLAEKMNELIDSINNHKNVIPAGEVIIEVLTIPGTPPTYKGVSNPAPINLDIDSNISQDFTDAKIEKIKLP